MPPFSGIVRCWTPGVCRLDISPECYVNTKKKNVMCLACWLIADPQEREDTKQAHEGYYCRVYGCFEMARRKFSTCLAHEGAAADEEGGGGAPVMEKNSTTDHGEPALLSEVMQRGITEANSSELKQIIFCATHRLANMAAHASSWRS